MLQDQALTWKVPSNQTEWQPQSWAIVWVLGMPRSVRVPLQRGLQEIPSIKLQSAEQRWWTLTVTTCSWGDSLNSFLHIGSIYYNIFFGVLTRLAMICACPPWVCPDSCQQSTVEEPVYLWLWLFHFLKCRGPRFVGFGGCQENGEKLKADNVYSFFSVWQLAVHRSFQYDLFAADFFMELRYASTLELSVWWQLWSFAAKSSEGFSVGSFHPQLVNQFGKT